MNATAIFSMITVLILITSMLIIVYVVEFLENKHKNNYWMEIPIVKDQDKADQVVNRLARLKNDIYFITTIVKAEKEKDINK